MDDFPEILGERGKRICYKEEAADIVLALWDAHQIIKIVDCATPATFDRKMQIAEMILQQYDRNEKK